VIPVSAEVRNGPPQVPTFRQSMVCVEKMTGYSHPKYAEALGEFGLPVAMPQCGGWVLERKIPHCDELDAMGCYPLFACRDWSSLRCDIEQMRDKWVSLVVVADPFGDYSVEYLKSCFPDVMKPFKQHFVVDLSESPKDFVVEHHRRNARKALQNLTVEVSNEPLALLNDWVSMYDVLIQRHHITGIAAFSAQSFAKQMQVPGMKAFRASLDGTSVGILLWYVMGDVAYYHLGAYSSLGYDLRASFALFSFAIDYFAQSGLRWLNLGAGAGVSQSENDGLARFKRGWSTGTRTAYFCGRIFDHGRYDEICRAKAIQTTGYFPAYRQGEFR
jgi:hypothetical protein